jgi:hypothetical protein
MLGAGLGAGLASLVAFSSVELAMMPTLVALICVGAGLMLHAARTVAIRRLLDHRA